MITSPTRPIACESEDIIENAPRSCRMSSAAIVSLRMRDSANATSSAMPGSRWWHTISMSRCSAMVFTVYGRVGLVEEGSTFASPHTLMMSGAWPPPAPSVWIGVDGAALERGDRGFDEARLVQRVGVDRDLHVHLVGDREAVVDRRRRRAPVLVELQARSRRPVTCSRSGSGRLALPLPRKPRFIGKASAAASIEWMCHGPGVQVVAIRAVRRAGAAADHRGDAGHQRFLDLLRADEVDVRVDAAGGHDHAFAGDDLGAGADGDRHGGLDVGIARLADLPDAAVLDADVGLDDAPVVDDERVGDHRVGDVLRRAAGSAPCRRGSPCRRRTSPPRRRSCSPSRPRSTARCRRAARGRRSSGRTFRHTPVGDLHIGASDDSGVRALQVPERCLHSTFPSPCPGSRTPCARRRARRAPRCASGRARSAPRCRRRC